MKPNTVGRAGGYSRQPHPVSPPAHAAGLVTGTIILTLDGEMPVEYLSAGDRIITRGAGMVRLQRIDRRRQMARAIWFGAGSLGDTRPDQDLLLPAAQKVLVRDWRARALFGQTQALVPADALIDGEFIRDLGPQPMLLHRLHFAHSHVIYAGGLEVAGACTAEARPHPVA